MVALEARSLILRPESGPAEASDVRPNRDKQWALPDSKSMEPAHMMQTTHPMC